ncbi:MAG: magnesium transporter [Epulopiscium sp. Nuni2H_MBin003]|nr:MAG: magnesium transporter [Epulopiscium sp. Nuni2H_MBin003]
MVNMYKSTTKRLKEIEKFNEGCWINIVSPTEDEIKTISAICGVSIEDLKLALDEEEKAHIEIEEDYIVIIVDVPVKDDEGVHEFITMPLSIIIGDSFIITISLKKLPLISDFTDGSVKNFFTYKKTRFILQLLYKNASYFLYYLRYIDRVSDKVEEQFEKGMKNKDLLYLLELEKSLVYFTTALRANEIVLEKMVRLDYIKQYPEDKELLEDVIIENKQAMEMANVYSSILSETRDAFSAVISNNLNTVMQRLTAITIVLALPTMIFSLFGMNVYIPGMEHPLAYFGILIISAICVIIGSIVMIKKNMF